MDNSTYPGSDTDVNENCDFHSIVSNELDFVDHWVNLTVEKEVLRGSKIREEKRKLYTQQDECEVVNVNFVPPCMEMKASYYSYRKHSPRRAQPKTVSCSPRSNSPFSRLNYSRAYVPQTMYSRSNTPSFKSKCIPRCPMRIAELAVPTKRQCFDTWRNKCDVLPACMVERLRQQIMDEKPIVQITDAISCFKRRKPRSIKSAKRSKKGTRDTKLKTERMNEIRKLCAAFANKIAQRLITPQNVKLTPELEKISKIVTDEITNIIRSRKKFDLDALTYKRIQADIADKVAVWIATILEDASYKILEDNLRVKKFSDRDVKEERLVTLIGKLLHNEKTLDLEEEEGPVLDFIDDLVNNVVTICEPQEMFIEDNISEVTSKGSADEKYDRSITSPDSKDNIEIDTATLYNNTYNTKGVHDIDNQSIDKLDYVANTELNINNHIREEINKIVDIVVPMENIEGNNKYKDAIVYDELKSDKDLKEEHTDLQKSPDNSELISQIKQVQNDIDLKPKNIVISSKNGSEEGIDDLVTEIENDNAENDNVSDVFVLLAEDEKNKKVKFSEIDMGTERFARQLDSTKQDENGHQKEKDSWHSSTESIKRDILFAPPNENLLSDADESWPDDITTPMLKPSASVSRSITSLGKIMEKDEKLLFIPEDEADNPLTWEDTHQTELEIFRSSNVSASRTSKERQNIQQASDQSFENKDESSVKKNHLDNIPKETLPNRINVDASVAIESETEHHFLSSTASPLRIAINDDTEPNQEIKGVEDVRNLESGTNVFYEAIQQKMKKSYVIAEPKHDYKVNAKTAPSWLRHDHGKGEPSEDSFRGEDKSKEKFKEADIRNWCKDLDRMFINLEMWSDWIDTTCKTIMHLKQKREMNKLFAPNARKKDAREWTNLKKNIDKDTVLWTKLNQRAYIRLKTYKNKIRFHQPTDNEELNVNDSFDTVLKTVQDIDKMCLWIHRTIVSTEYCVLCDCKNNTKAKDQ